MLQVIQQLVHLFTVLHSFTRRKKTSNATVLYLFTVLHSSTRICLRVRFEDSLPMGKMIRHVLLFTVSLNIPGPFFRSLWLCEGRCIHVKSSIKFAYLSKLCTTMFDSADCTCAMPKITLCMSEVRATVTRR